MNFCFTVFLFCPIFVLDFNRDFAEFGQGNDFWEQVRTKLNYICAGMIHGVLSQDFVRLRSFSCVLASVSALLEFVAPWRSHDARRHSSKGTSAVRSHPEPERRPPGAQVPCPLPGRAVLAPPLRLSLRS